MADFSKNLGKKISWVLLGLFIAFQTFPVSRANPTVTDDFPNINVKQVLQASCYDCHSHETQWPWESYVAPVSWIVSHHVEEGRDNLNFSQWGSLSQAEQAFLKREIWEEVEKGAMPLPMYTWLHPSARLSQPKKTIDSILGQLPSTPLNISFTDFVIVL